VIGGLAAGGWLAGKWLSPRPVPADPQGPPAVAAGTAAESPRAPSKPLVTRPPKDVQIAAMREEALGVLAELEQRFGTNASVLSAVGSVYVMYGQDAEAQRRWDRALHLDPKCALVYHAMASAAAVRGEYDETIRLARKALDLDPRLTRARLVLGEALTSTGQMDEAAKELEQYVAREPKSVQGLFRLGQAYYHLKQYAKAKEAHQRVLRLDGKFEASHHSLANICDALGEVQEAEKHRNEFARLGQSKPEFAKVERGGLDDLGLGRTNLTETHLIAARAYMAAAKAQRKPDYLPEGERHLVAAARTDPKSRDARLALLNLYEENKRLREAVDVLGELEAIDPKDSTHRINRGILLARLQEFDQAEKEFREAIALAPDEPDGYAKLGWLRLSQKSKLGEARELANSAIRLGPKVANHHLLLAMVCEELGDVPAALAAIEQALALEPDNPRAQEIKARLDGKKKP
jgi:tetratricopeptide (TPR) repeat protein